MLARFAKVDPSDGKILSVPEFFTRLRHYDMGESLRGACDTFGLTSVQVQSNIVLRLGRALARGVTIAIRYCAVRRQFVDRDNAAPDTETQVLD